MNNKWTIFQIAMTVLFLALFFAKLAGVVTLSWWLVFSPAIVVALIVAIFITAIELWYMNR